jgi:SAM-dependent methyltransferase
MYQASYFDDYYNGSYEDTYQLSFPLIRILQREWAAQYNNPPQSFADIGCGCGQTLLKARELLPEAKLIYGVENQEIPEERLVSKDVILGDFMNIYPQLPSVDLLYVACSMYIPWDRQEEFLTASIALAKKAIVFANIYLEDGVAIPQDSLRTIIYNNRKNFIDIMNSLGFKFCGNKNVEMFIPN